MIYIKTPAEIAKMQEAGKIANEAMKHAVSAVKAGIKTIDLDKIAEDIIVQMGATPSFKHVDGYKFATCINVNSGIVHGIPNNYVLQPGDIVSIDLGAYKDGFHSDISYSLEVETKNETKFLQTGLKALENAIFECVPGNKIGDIAFAMQNEVESKGYTVSRDLVGHGIGRELHEDPYVPCFGSKGKGIPLKEGMVLAIEVIYQKGSPELVLAEDDWTLSTADGSISGLFEKTVAISRDGPVLLTSFFH